jgi:hypothetical protein
MTWKIPALAVAAVGFAAGAEAATWETIKGVQYFSDQVWTNQLDGEPVAAFPQDCEGDGCDYTIWMEHRPGIGGAASADCIDDPTTAWFDCEPNDTCIVGVEFGPDVMPLTDWHGYRAGNPEPMDNALIGVSYLDQEPRTTFPLWVGHNEFHGHDFQLLNIIGGELDITSNDLCRVGVAARYHEDSRTVYDQGLFLP